jgi:hypothetical protein
MLAFTSFFTPNCSVAEIRIRIYRIHMFLGLPVPDPLVRSMDPDLDPSTTMQKYQEKLDSYYFVTLFDF